MISRELAQTILKHLEEVSQVFGDFQKMGQLHCPPSCGKCCFNPEISCAPYELLPLALHLLGSNRAEEMLELAQTNLNTKCILLQVLDEEKGNGRCSDYAFRPFICRAFGVSARHGKKGTDYSICRVLKSNDSFTPDFNHIDEDIPYIEVWKKRIEAIDPKLLEREIPINQALAVILEKVLLWDTFQKKSTRP